MCGFTEGLPCSAYTATTAATEAKFTPSCNILRISPCSLDLLSTRSAFVLKHPTASCQQHILSALSSFLTTSVLHLSSFIILDLPGGMARVSHGRGESGAAGASSSCSWRAVAMAEPLLGYSILCLQDEHTPHCPSRRLKNRFLLPKIAMALVLLPSNSSRFPGIPNTSLHPSKPRPRCCEGLPGYAVTHRCLCICAACARPVSPYASGANQELRLRDAC